MSKRAKAGRPAKYATDSNGRPIVGLSFDKNNNLYFNTHWKTENISKQSFGTDKNEAIYRFRQWEEERKGEANVSVDEDDVQVGIREQIEKFNPDLRGYSQETLREWAGKEHFAISEVNTYEIPLSLVCSIARELILNDIHKARKLLNLPIVLDGKVFSEKSIELAKVKELYFEKRRKPMSSAYIKIGKLLWNDFIKCIGVKRVSDITIDLIDKYEDYLYDCAKTKKWASASINNRIGLVKAALSYAAKKVNSPSDIEHLRRVLQYAERLTRAEKAKLNPCPISVEDFHKMLNCTEEKTYKAVLLMALNCGMRESDLIDIRITPRKGQPRPDINLKDKTLQMPRPKTGIIRVAVLWDRTVAAINVMLDEREKKKIKSEYLFLNSFDKPMKEASIRKWWLRHREDAGVIESVKFEHIRDATQTIPLDDDPRSLVETNLIMGHSVKGMANNYLERRPNMVRRACAVIEECFFVKPKKQKAKKVKNNKDKK